MAESMKGLHRSCRCAEVTKEMIGRELTLMGWVQKARDKGGIVFVRSSAKKLAVKQIVEGSGRVNPQKASARVNPQKASARNK